jgi:hypothetical protein
MKNLTKKVVHLATIPFVDKGPFGGGPAYSGTDGRRLATSIFELNRATWTPPSQLFRGATGEYVAEIGRRFPILNIGDGSELNYEHEFLCEFIMRAAKRAEITGDVEDGIITSALKTGWDVTKVDRQDFIHRLEDPNLLEVDAHNMKVVDAAFLFCCSRSAGIELDAEDWKDIVYRPFSFTRLDEDKLQEKLDNARYERGASFAP